MQLRDGPDRNVKCRCMASPELMPSALRSLLLVADGVWSLLACWQSGVEASLLVRDEGVPEDIWRNTADQRRTTALSFVKVGAMREGHGPACVQPCGDGCAVLQVYTDMIRRASAPDEDTGKVCPSCFSSHEAGTR